MAEYHVSAGVFGIYAGTLMPKKDGNGYFDVTHWMPLPEPPKEVQK